jgi:hypothetical protein
MTFVTSPTPFGLGNINIPSNGPNFNPVGISAAELVGSMARAAADRYAPIAISAADNVAQNIADRVSNIGRRTNDGSRSRGRSSGRGRRGNGNGGGNGSSGNGQNNNLTGNSNGSIPLVPNNTTITWNSGIRSGTNVNERQSDTDTFSPLYMICGTFFPDSEFNDDSSFFGEIVGQDIYREVISNIQRNVSYRSDRDFSREQFYEYLYLVTSLLQLYYMVDSILVTCNHNSRNRGIFHLREQLSSDVILQHIRLKELLETVPIPSNLLNFIRYMYQSHSASLEKNAPILRLSYMNLFLDDEANENKINPSIYKELINQVNEQPFTRLMSLIAIAMPEWIHQELPYSTYDYIYDPQFLTFWFNCGGTFSNDGVGILHTKSVTNSHEQHEYYQFTPEVDGGIYACSSVYTTETKHYETGIWVPYSGFNENLKKGNCTSLLMYRNS